MSLTPHSQESSTISLHLDVVDSLVSTLVTGVAGGTHTTWEIIHFLSFCIFFWCEVFFFNFLIFQERRTWYGRRTRIRRPETFLLHILRFLILIHFPPPSLLLHVSPANLPLLLLPQEHIHVYEPLEGANDETVFATPFHTDNGLLLMITPFQVGWGVEAGTGTGVGIEYFVRNIHYWSRIKLAIWLALKRWVEVGLVCDQRYMKISESRRLK